MSRRILAWHDSDEAVIVAPLFEHKSKWTIINVADGRRLSQAVVDWGAFDRMRDEIYMLDKDGMVRSTQFKSGLRLTFRWLREGQQLVKLIRH